MGGKLEAAVDIGKERAQVSSSHPARKVVQGKKTGEEGARVEARMNADGKNRGFSHGYFRFQEWGWRSLSVLAAAQAAP